MINLKPAILAALEANAALVALLGGKRIYELVAPDADEFPRVVFQEIDNRDVLYANDEAQASEIPYQVSIFAKGSTTAIAAQVDITMKSLGFTRSGAVDLYEPDTQACHKAMRYRITKEL